MAAARPSCSREPRKDYSTAAARFCGSAITRAERSWPAKVLGSAGAGGEGGPGAGEPAVVQQALELCLVVVDVA